MSGIRLDLEGCSLDSIRDLRLYQFRRGYRYGTDSLLLADFAAPAGPPDPGTIADLGAGCGILALLLARRYPRARLLAVEIQPELAALTRTNVALNDLADRVAVRQDDVRLMQGATQAGRFDLIISNPPYRRPGSGRPSPDRQRQLARHEVLLDVKTLARAAAALLGPTGRFCLCHRPERLDGILAALSEAGLGGVRMRHVHPTVGKPSRLVLIEACRTAAGAVTREAPFILYGRDGTPTKAFRAVVDGPAVSAPAG